MNIDKSSLDRLASLDDTALRMKILKIAGECGADTKKLAQKLNVQKLKSSISSMDQKDIDRIVSLLGTKNARILKDNLENGE